MGEGDVPGLARRAHVVTAPAAGACGTAHVVIAQGRGDAGRAAAPVGRDHDACRLVGQTCRRSSPPSLGGPARRGPCHDFASVRQPCCGAHVVIVQRGGTRSLRASTGRPRSRRVPGGPVRARRDRLVADPARSIAGRVGSADARRQEDDMTEHEQEAPPATSRTAQRRRRARFRRCCRSRADQRRPGVRGHPPCRGVAPRQRCCARPVDLLAGQAAAAGARRAARCHRTEAGLAAGPDVTERIEWVHADLIGWTPGGRRFDLVTCSYVHVPEPQRTCPAGSRPESRQAERCSSSATARVTGVRRGSRPG